MEILCKPCAKADLPALQDLCRRTFQETYAADNTPANVQTHLDTAYSSQKLAAEWANPDSRIYLLYADGRLAGYLKCNQGAAQTEFQAPDALEIQRIYLLRDFQGQGLGGYLLTKAVAAARNRGKKYIWLGVWEKNRKAMAFYEKHGFRKVGAHPFLLGRDRQTDYILRLDL